MTGARLTATLHNDPGCPWAYSVNPALRVLEWRYGSQLEWRLVLIGLAERAEQYVARGYTPRGVVTGYTRFRRYGMPFSPHLRPRVLGTGRACRAVAAARFVAPGSEWQVFRALQFAWFTSAALLDEDEALHDVVARVPGVDAAAVIAHLDAPEVTAAYESDRAEARRASLRPAELQGKTVQTDGPVRYSAPSLILECDGRRLEAGGFQTIQAYDVLVANLDPGLSRRAAPDGPAPLLDAFPGGLTTQEVAALLVAGNDEPDRLGAERAQPHPLRPARAARAPLGDDALWLRAR